ncbi:helix-turn-helix domain-containing protein [Enterococcus casseliflavus]|uniref:helix-turn-helix domain-containing protein n=1 Tax=Enterococcus casseliflavus TaxID=37734 RepID=UPI003D0E9D90
MKDTEFKAEYEAEKVKLAALATVPQSTIARIERGDNTSFERLSKLASALGKTLTVSLV